MSRHVVMTIGVLMAVTAVTAAFSGHGFEVRQKNRAFSPRDLQIDRGDVVHIINDDGELLHHAYVDSETFHFDSGEQEPGSTIDIRFTKAGTFAVLCGIHPKMRLNVTVR
jgi:plastocyanin